MDMAALCYKKCSTCQKALKWLDVNGIQYQERPIKKEHLSEAELKAQHEKNGLPLKKFSNTSGNLYKEMAPRDEFPQTSEEEQLALLIIDGMLAKRLPVMANDLVLTGFREGEWKEKMMQGPKTGRQRKRRLFLWRLFFGECLL